MAISVFISYCKKDRCHAKKVALFAADLEKQGFSVVFDEAADPPVGWYLWMEQSMAKADFVLCVFDKHYAERFAGEEVGKGVDYEAGMARSILYRKYPYNTKIIPVLMNRTHHKLVPSILESYSRFVYSCDLDKLCRTMEDRHAKEHGSTRAAILGKEMPDAILPVEEVRTAKSRLPGEVFAIELLERPVQITRYEDDRFLVEIDRRDVKWAVVTNQGKEWLFKTFVRERRSQLEEQDRAAQDFLLGKSREERFVIDLPKLGIPLRWASGGVMSVVTWEDDKRKEKWTPFFFRDKKPWGWNIALGSCERWFDEKWQCKRPVSTELSDPEQFLLREFREETLILQGEPRVGPPLQFKRFFFDEKDADRQRQESQEFAKKHIEQRRIGDGLQIQLPPLPQTGLDPASLRIHRNNRTKTDMKIIDPDGKEHLHLDVVISFNLMELGIEVVKVFEYLICAGDSFLDGELLVHKDGSMELVRMPVALISHRALARTFAPEAYSAVYTDDIPPSFLGKPIGSDEINVFDWDVRRRLERMVDSSVPEIERQRYRKWRQEYSKPPKAFVTSSGAFNRENIPCAYIPGTAKTLCQYFARMA